MRGKTMIMLALVACLVLSGSVASLGSPGAAFGPDADDRISSAAPAEKARLVDTYGKLAMRFEPNVGQAGAGIDFVGSGKGYRLALSATKSVLATDRATVAMEVVGANPEATPRARDPLAGVVNYLVGDDPADWHTGIATYGKVLYEEVYPGIDLAYYSALGQLEYDFIVAPGAKPDQIGLGFAGAEEVRIDHSGALVVKAADGVFRHDPPRLYQDIAGRRHPVAGRFVMRSGRVGFDVGSYDGSRPLVIDPVLAYSTHLGGGGDDYAMGIAVDGTGHAYVTGRTRSANFATSPGAHDATCDSGASGCDMDAFVTKLSPNGSALVYSTFVGGARGEGAVDIALDAAGAAHVVGFTASPDFPVTSGAVKSTCPLGTFDPTFCRNQAFVTKLTRDGSTLAYSSFLGGSRGESALAVDLGPLASIYVLGATSSEDFFTTAGAFQEVDPSPGVADGNAFLAKIDPNANGGAGLIYATYLGGGREEPGDSGDGRREVVGDLVVDNAGVAYLTGVTNSSDFPVTPGAFQSALGGSSEDAFIARLNPGGNGPVDLEYSSFLGGSAPDDIGNRLANDYGTGVALGPRGSVYLTGGAGSTDFPVTANAFQTSMPGCSNLGCDAFVAKLNLGGNGPSDMIYSTYLGAPGTGEAGTAIAVDADGHAIVSGATSSTTFPTRDRIQRRCGCFTSVYLDAFVTELNPAGSGDADLIFSTWLGGNGWDIAHDLALDSVGAAYITGATNSPVTDNPNLAGRRRVPYPTTHSVFQPRKAGGFDGFISKIKGLNG